MSPIDIAVSIAKLTVSLIMLYIIGAIGYAIYLFFNPDKGRPSGWYWPDFINEWIGMPKTFSVATSNIAIGTDILDQIINVASANDCMSNCNNNKDCIGFVYVASSNTCNTFSVIGGLLPAAGSSVSNVYIVDGNVPKGFILKSNMGQSLRSNIAPYSSPWASLDCAANCAANVTCTGFTMSGTPQLLCSQQTDPNFGTALVAITNTDSLLIGDLKLPSSGNGYIT
jgi:hypothetical protein